MVIARIVMTMPIMMPGLFEKRAEQHGGLLRQ